MGLAKIKNLFLEMLFPQFCLHCGREGALICEDCLSLIDISEFVFCPFCKHPRRVFNTGKCPSHQSMRLDGLFSASSYQELVLRKIIARFKYPPYLKTLAKPLAYLIITHFHLTKNEQLLKTGDNSILVPVPLLPAKKRKRGFNQAELIAKELSSFFNLPLVSHNLIKIKKTVSQTGLSRQERQENIASAFVLKNPAEIQDKKVFLIDDVFTSGATAEEAARILKLANAQQVYAITPARQPLV